VEHRTASEWARRIHSRPKGQRSACSSLASGRPPTAPRRPNALTICHNLPMCGRYRLSRRKQLIDEYFGTVSDDDWTPRYNIAPTQPVPVIRQNPNEPSRELSLMRWGLIPSWAKDSSVAAQTINARSETAATKPAFRDALVSRRCLIPADGFYEWWRIGQQEKQPYCFEVNDGELFAFAGLWDRWKDPSTRVCMRPSLCAGRIRRQLSVAD
jgi:SOS response associated peptidase (SRAP)